MWFRLEVKVRHQGLSSTMSGISQELDPRECQAGDTAGFTRADEYSRPGMANKINFRVGDEPSHGTDPDVTAKLLLVCDYFETLLETKIGVTGDFSLEV